MSGHVYTEEFISHAKNMARSGRIPIYGEFNESLWSLAFDCIHIAEKSLFVQKREWCTLLIDSSGGNFEVLNSIRSFMFESGLKFRGLVRYRAAGSGFYLLQNCNWRVASNIASLSLYYTAEDLLTDRLSLKYAYQSPEFWIDYLNQHTAFTFSEISSRSGLSAEEIRGYFKFKRDILADEALKLGFLDEVVTSVPKSEKPTEELN